MKVFIIILLAVSLIAAQETRNYLKSKQFSKKLFCGSGNCKFGYVHISCIYKMEFSVNCPPGVVLIAITPHLQHIVLHAHNEKRDFVASGQQANHMPACRMATMQWDDKLASLAELAAVQCTAKYDYCHNTYKYRYAGQNVGIFQYNGAADVEKLLRYVINIWYNEGKYSDKELIQSFRVRNDAPPTGHFTTLVNDNNVAVGCGAITYTNSSTGVGNVMVVCNYARSNLIGSMIYQACDVPGSKCETGPNPSYQYLCSIDEVHPRVNLPY